MTDDSTRLTRRTALKGLGGAAAAGVGGLGVLSLTGSAAAASFSAAGPVDLSHDRGQVNAVTIDPEFSVTWSNLDDAVAKVFYLVEAKVGGGEWWPLFRATPWLPVGREDTSVVTAESGTTGEYTLNAPHSAVLNADGRLTGEAGPLVVADGDGVPDYAGADWANYGPSDETRYLNGVSMGNAQDAADGLSLTLQNNYPDLNAGYYGAAGAASDFESGTDGETASTQVQVRYTFELQRANVSWAQSVTGLNTSDHETLASHLPGFQASDIDDGNSTIVMNGEDGQHPFESPSGIPYADLQSNADSHVGALTGTATFTVNVENEASGNTSGGSTNPGGSVATPEPTPTATSTSSQ